MRFNYIELAKILSETRKKSKISMRKLAFAVGVSHAEIARIESGNREAPNVVTIIKMCEVLGLNPIIILLKTNFFTIEMLDDLFNTHNQIVNKYDRNNSKIKPDMLYEFANFLEKFLSESFLLNEENNNIKNCESCKYYCPYCKKCNHGK